MKVTAEAIRKKVADLPEDFADHVHLTADPSTAEVESFSGTDIYTVHIESHKDDPGDRSILDVASYPSAG